MSNVTFLAPHDLTLECDLGNVEIKKGYPVYIEHDEDDNVFILHHEEKDNKVNAFEISITDQEILVGLLESVVLKEDELDGKLSYEDIDLDTLILDEGVDVDKLACYLAEGSFKLKKAVRGGKVTKVRVPVNRVKKKASPKQKAARLKQVKALARSPKAKKARLKSLKVRKQRGLGETGYLINHDYFLNESLSTVAFQTKEVLESAFGDKARVSLNKEKQIIVKLALGDDEGLKEALSSADVNYIIEGIEKHKIITLIKPQTPSVVESYYAKKVEEKDDDMEKELEEKKMKMGKMKEKFDGMDDDDKDKADLKGKIKELEAEIKDLEKNSDHDDKDMDDKEEDKKKA